MTKNILSKIKLFKLSCLTPSNKFVNHGKRIKIAKNWKTK